VCKPHKVTGERPIAESRALTVADVEALDPYDDHEFHDNDEPVCDGLCPWNGPCACEVEPPHESFAYRPLAILARVA
jgi:hypothetical protein